MKEQILKSLRFCIWIGFLCMSYHLALGQIAEPDPRAAAITAFLNSEKVMSKLNSIAHKQQFSGAIEYQMVWKKGAKVLHCRMLQSSEEHHPFITLLHKEMMKMRCKVKIEPGEQVKLQHTFHFHSKSK